eukprot:1158698-Pelagomonas_calceolata.AAC.6
MAAAAAATAAATAAAAAAAAPYAMTFCSACSAAVAAAASSYWQYPMSAAKIHARQRVEGSAEAGKLGSGSVVENCSILDKLEYISKLLSWRCRINLYIQPVKEPIAIVNANIVRFKIHLKVNTDPKPSALSCACEMLLPADAGNVPLREICHMVSFMFKVEHQFSSMVKYC